MFKKTFLSAAIAAGSLMSLAPMAHAQYNAIVAVGPPPAVHEVVPQHRSGYVWAPGHHEWRGNQYVWVPGHWMQARDGYAYHEPRWIQRSNGESAASGNAEGTATATVTESRTDTTATVTATASRTPTTAAPTAPITWPGISKARMATSTVTVS